MRSTDEQLREIGTRSARLKAQAELRRPISMEVMGICACIVLLAVVAITLPTVDAVPSTVEATGYASLVLTGPALGYVVIGVLAFILGICVALLSIHMRRWRKL